MTGEADLISAARRLGEIYAGPALAAYRAWLAKEHALYSIDLASFLGPDCDRLRRVSGPDGARQVLWPADAEVSLRLAEVEHHSIDERLIPLSTTFQGMTARQVFARFDVPPPAAHVLADLGLHDGQTLGFGQEKATHRFLRAFRWDFYRAAARLRARWFRDLTSRGIGPGMHVAVVGMVFDGRLIELAERVVRGMMDVNVHGHAFLLSDVEQRWASDARFLLKSYCEHLGLPEQRLAALRERASLLTLALQPARPGTPGAALNAAIDDGIAAFQASGAPGRVDLLIDALTADDLPQDLKPLDAVAPVVAEPKALARTERAETCATELPGRTGPGD